MKKRSIQVTFRATQEERDVIFEIAKELDVSVSSLFVKYIHSLAKTMNKTLPDPATKAVNAAVNK